tara:strand:- start:331 stop:1278 length:948 start_codon:yes stop_codon:yes gene_type:complete
MEPLTTESALKKLRGNGKPLGFVIVAVLIADSSDMLFELVSIGIGKIKPARRLPPLPHIDAWMRMYRSHRFFTNQIASSIGLPAELFATEILDEMRALSRASESEIADLTNELSEQEIAQFLRPLLGVPFPPETQMLKKMLLDHNTKTEDDSEIVDELYESVSVQFFIRVWMPCWVLYRELPGILIRKSRLGDHDSLDKLLRLDKSVVHDPRIAQIWHDIMHNGSKSDRKRFKNAMADGPKVKLTARSLKLGLAGLISQLAIQSRSPVTSIEIRKLFDSISKIRSGGIDTSMPESPDAMRKDLQRQRNWPPISTP